MLNLKVLHRNLKIISTSFHKDTDNNIMKNIKRKTESTPSDYIKGIFQESNIFLSQSQPKNLVRLLSNSSISWNMSLTTWTFKCNDKRCKICRFYIIMFWVWIIKQKNMESKSKYQLWQQKHVNFLWMKPILEKQIHGFHTRMNNHITKSRKGINIKIPQCL